MSADPGSQGQLAGFKMSGECVPEERKRVEGSF